MLFATGASRQRELTVTSNHERLESSLRLTTQMNILPLLIAGIVAVKLSTAFAAIPSEWPEHPRLIANQSAWAKLREQIQTDRELRDFTDGLVSEARKVLPAPTLERRMQGRRLLGVSRETLRRVLLCSFAYRLTGENEFLERAKSDMLAAAAFQDWNPSHFLDVAEMATALAFGYDWLHAGLDERTRATLRGALVKNALEHGRNGHSSFRSHNNWNQVCIGGLAMAAMAIADEEPVLARSVLEAARRDINNGLQPYRPHGIYPEGPSYWEYGTSYTVLLVAALRSATGGDWGIMDAKGLKESAPWVVHMTGPSGAFYNFADGSARAGLMPSLFFFARELDQPALLAFQRNEVRRFAKGGHERLAPLAAFWWQSFDKSGGRELPLFWAGSGLQPVAAWRSSWNSNAFYFAIKAGGASANHAHMDGGSFILEADGVRWAEDLGLQDYHSLESRGVQLWSMTQDAQRWRIFRLGPFSHNTLTIEGQMHNARGMAELNHADEQGARLDLTPIFLPGQVSKAIRQATISTNSVEITDTIEGAAAGAEVRWAMATRAQIQVVGDRAILRNKSRRLEVDFHGLTPEILDISQPATDLDAPNPEMRLLIARIKAGADGQARIRVSLSAESQK
jgi:oligo-alginate lyase